MPRKNKNAKQVRRTPYRPDATAELERIEKKREALGVTLADLASRAGLTERTFTNIRRHKRAFPRHIRALTYALRTIAREIEAQAGVIK
ncbi:MULTISPECIES: hypothetical protein [unclassified Mesorhizobium]|uniref:hypothetical protein n=1 Tax=unclassified Mesorhizobium TaxID=325217 RepID=UPI00112B196A|nr:MULTISPECIES: hypothetical protein [unclassified Mesorhizobium]TPM06780.1 hypothetical protein FJ939_12000 [Mesorhizobium sp. B2-3-8]TPM15337.1 hypothetical protein FJ940_14105 [Mesorhizobium sp. B2-3-7]